MKGFSKNKNVLPLVFYILQNICTLCDFNIHAVSEGWIAELTDEETESKTQWFRQSRFVFLASWSSVPGTHFQWN